MQFKSFAPDIEVNGQTVWSIVDGFISKRTPSRVLADEGIGTLNAEGLVEIDKSHWYPQDAWLRAFEKISTTLGDHVLFSIGKRVPENATFPPWVVDIVSAIKSVDIAYHLNHRKAGKVMFDTRDGAMIEGIGHYGFQPAAAPARLIVSECHNPYPCDFDLGILTAMARRFQPLATVSHADAKHCRKAGGESCTYHVKW